MRDTRGPVWKLLTAIGMVLALLVLIPLFVAALILALPFVVILSGYSRYRLATNGRPIRWLKLKLGWGLGVRELARRLEMPADELRRFQPVYRVARIPKRSGGQRTLFIPDAATRALQRRLLRRVLRRLKAHPAACGFEAGRSIVDNARPHVGQAVVIRLDVVDFFPSTTAARVERYFRAIGWNRAAAELLVRLTTHEGGLPQGAPTSPRLSNLVNYFLDVKLDRHAQRRRGAYTRYADDITISFPRDHGRRARGTVQYVRRLLKAHGYQLHRDKKLSIRRRHQRQQVTGLVVNETVQLPRATRRRLRAVLHHHETGRPATMTLEQLQGWAALQAMILRQRDGNPDEAS
ncbi:MAG: RNA-directed DNA polymerase [Planctomycetales bacterium]|nr:RNA-directed DNA polymerase [Planctomycetales bacterium]